MAALALYVASIPLNTKARRLPGNFIGTVIAVVQTVCQDYSGCRGLRGIKLAQAKVVALDLQRLQRLARLLQPQVRHTFVAQKLQ